VNRGICPVASLAVAFTFLKSNQIKSTMHLYSAEALRVSKALERRQSVVSKYRVTR